MSIAPRFFLSFYRACGFSNKRNIQIYTAYFFIPFCAIACSRGESFGERLHIMLKIGGNPAQVVSYNGHIR